MLSTLIKHFIYEECINLAYRRVGENFKTIIPKVRLVKLVISDEMRQDLKAIHGIDLDAMLDEMDEFAWDHDFVGQPIRIYRDRHETKVGIGDQIKTWKDRDRNIPTIGTIIKCSR